MYFIHGPPRISILGGDPRDFFQPTLINVNSKLQKTLDGLLDKIAEHDATAIYGATQGWGTSDEKLIRILTGRTKMQNKRTDKMFRVKYDKCVHELLAEVRHLTGPCCRTIIVQ